MIPDPPVLAPSSSRQRFRRHRARVFLAFAVVAAALAAVGIVLFAPAALGTLRLGGVGVAWWAASAALALDVAALAIGLPIGRDHR